MAADVKKLMDIITDQTSQFFKEEINLDIGETRFFISDVNRLKLKHLTSLLSVGGDINMYLVFSFEKQLIDHIFDVYTEELDIEEDERDEYVEETAGDVINIIVGNAAGWFESGGVVVQLTPPVILTEAKNISRQKNACFYMAEIETIHGNLSVFCAGPRKLMNENLDYIE